MGGICRVPEGVWILMGDVFFAMGGVWRLM